MANHRNRFPARRRFLKQSSVLTAATMVALPRLGRAAPVPQPASEGEATRADGAARRTGAAPRTPRAPGRKSEPKS